MSKQYGVRLIAVLLLGLVLRLPTFASTLLSDDEAIYATTADAMRRGDVLYRDVVDHKPPAIYDVYLAGFRAFGPYNTQGAHLMVVASVLLTAVLLAGIGRRVYRDDDAGLVAALLWVVFSTTMLAFDSLAANCELFLVLPQALAVDWLTRRGTFSGSASARAPAFADAHIWFGAGLMAGAAVMFKYQAATFLLVIAGAILIDLIAGRRSVASAAWACALCAAGCAVVPGLYVLKAWYNGSLREMWYWFSFNFAYIAAGPATQDAIRLGLIRVALLGFVAAFLPYAFGAAGVWRTLTAWRGAPARERAQDGFIEGRTLLVLWLIGSVIAVCAGGRFFGHYFHLILPALSLLAAGPLLEAWRARQRLRLAFSALVVVPALVFLAAATVARDAIAARTDPKPAYAPVVARVRALTIDTDPIFVWGNTPQIYALAQRPMGSRFSFCNYMTGVSPGTETEWGGADPDRNALPRAWDLLLADLERRRPRLLVDAAAADWDRYGRFPIARYPSFAAYVRAHYVQRERVDGVVLYERSDR